MEAAATHGMAAFPSQNLANLVWAYATLGRSPGASLTAAVQRRIAASLEDFTPKVRTDVVRHVEIHSFRTQTLSYKHAQAARTLSAAVQGCRETCARQASPQPC